MKVIMVGSLFLLYSLCSSLSHRRINQDNYSCGGNKYHRHLCHIYTCKHECDCILAQILGSFYLESKNYIKEKW